MEVFPEEQSQEVYEKIELCEKKCAMKLLSWRKYGKDRLYFEAEYYNFVTGGLRV